MNQPTLTCAVELVSPTTETLEMFPLSDVQSSPRVTHSYRFPVLDIPPIAQIFARAIKASITNQHNPCPA